MIDFIKASKNLCDKDTIFFGHCEVEAEYPKSGWTKYSLLGCNKLEIRYHHINRLLKLSGSLPYFLKGHNFTFSASEFCEAIDLIGELLSVSVWDAYLDSFEFGVIMQVDEKPCNYIKHHYTKSNEKLALNEKPKDKGAFRWWEGSNVKLKMYDAGLNIKNKQSIQTKERIFSEGFIPENNYLKWEAHYLKPELFNSGRGLLLADLVHPNWIATFKEDLYLQYQRLIPMKSIVIPSNKKDLTSADILMLVLAEASINESVGLGELRKKLYAKINDIPALSAEDKKNRKRQIKTLLGKLKEDSSSKWDLSGFLGNALS